MLLGAPLPRIITNNSAVAYPSSPVNDYYGPIGSLVPWPLPNNLCGYASLPEDTLYYPPNHDPTTSIITEADAVLSAMFTAVNIVLANNALGYSIRCNSEECQSITVNLGGGLTKTHLSRVDESWSYGIGNDFKPFAILEFKRPGAIRSEEWFNTPNDTVWGSGDNICRQLKKYANAYMLRCVGVCDLRTLILMELGGGQAGEEWYSGVPEQAPKTSASIRCITEQNQVKREMYVFLKYALKSKLRADGLIN
jgi:hypothetical protein